ncbi:ABC transporter permease [Hufsiella ginkgonis]|uniref:FtsX-like permease family protein n=1 Tax=Hufsiella ginkgonis TaxID=2695274 RepID=A0A7K1XV43_9SPHI|nr:ABC transporter permease [Hufsiella ginkgonis]MXV14852.1 FtsX-like permease family protein [Hufsiella ginkgonis]
MLRNYLHIALRNLLKKKGFTFINISGLAIGMTCVILISLYVKNELSYDRSFNDSDRIFRVNINGKMGAEEFYAGYTPPTAGSALLRNFPEVESFARIYRPGEKVIRYKKGGDDRLFTEKGIFGVDSNFFEVLNYPLKQGDQATCLRELNSIVISEEIAKKYFGDADPLGKELLYDVDGYPFVVTGVLAKQTNPVSLQFDVVMPVNNFRDVHRFSWSWVWLNMATYVKLKKNVPADAAAIARLEAKFPAMMKVEAVSAFARIGQPYEEFLKKGGKWDLHLQPLKDIHLRSGAVQSGVTDQGDIKYVYIFSLVALFVVLLACVNFMNLSTAQSAKRAREVGVRKVLGSARKQLIGQFLAEAFLFSVIASAIALIAVKLTLPWFNQLAGKSLVFSSFFTNGTWLILVLLILFSGFVAGSYPAFVLTSFNPVTVLKGTGLPGGHRGSRNLRSGLVVFQFTVSTALIICTMVVYNQLHYAQHRDLGLTKENVIVIANSKRLGESEKAFRNEVAQLPQVLNASITTGVPTKDAFGDFYVPIAGDEDKQVAKDLTLNSYMADDDFISSMGLKLVAGRAFSKEFKDSASIILNETAVKQIGWKKPLGQLIRYPGGHMESYKVIGIVRDFNVESLHYAVTPFALFHTSSHTYDIRSSYVVVRVAPGDPSHVVKALQDKWRVFSPATPFDYSFLDTDFDMLYRADQRIGAVFGTFTGLSIFVACLGLFALVAFTAEQRTKEIGIRKVLGSSVSGIVRLLSKDFIVLVVIAIVIASPLAWWAMHYWLQDFTYRVTIGWWVFAGAAAVAVFIALLTVSFQAVKAAMANPVRSLRNE